MYILGPHKQKSFSESHEAKKAENTHVEVIASAATLAIERLS